jgi:hypothetical protein
MGATPILAQVAQHAEDGPFCPQCGATMVEADKLLEGNAAYVWHECSKEACDGQWLEKTNKP